MSGIQRPTSTGSRMSTAPSSQKPRQLSHLHSQLAQLTANMADLENLLRMTAVQAESMRGLGGYCGGMYVHISHDGVELVLMMELRVVQARGCWRECRRQKTMLICFTHRFMAASKVLGEETVNGGNAPEPSGSSHDYDKNAS